MKPTYHFTASIHTLSLKADSIVPAEVIDYPCVENVLIDGKSGNTFLKINPNKYSGGAYAYSDFESIMNQIINDCELNPDSLQLHRADLRLDSYDSDFFMGYAKRHRLLISMMSHAYSVPNRYITMDLFSEEPRSLAFVNPHFEMECYDKYAESMGRELTKARLELRSKRIGKGLDYIPYEFIEHWGKRFKKASESLPSALTRYNSILAKQYYDQKDNTPVKFRSLTEFLLQNQERLFMRKQIVDLLRRLKIDNPEKAADNYIYRYKIELLSDIDIKATLEEINRATDEFFSS